MLYFFALSSGYLNRQSATFLYFQKLSSTAKINGRQFILERMRCQND